MQRGKIARTLALLAALGFAAIAANRDYQSEIAEWRRQYDVDLRSEKGPLYLIGRFALPEGRSEIGSDPSSRITLPHRAPKRVGAIVRKGDQFTFEPASGVAVQWNGKPLQVPTAIKTGAIPSARDKLEIGDFELAISGLDAIYQLLVRDRHSAYLQTFHGAVWFPVLARYRVQGDFTAYAHPEERKIPDTAGRSRSMRAPGYVTFRLNGQALRLEPVISGEDLLFMFKDGTSGHETYGAGRFLEAAMPKDGKVMLDFNKAYSPYCAVNPYMSCPIPPKQNTLATRIEAGEKYSGTH